MASDMPGGNEPIARGGPHVRACLLCERVLREDDGTLSAIRIVHATLVPPGPAPPAQTLTLLVMLVRGDERPGLHHVLLKTQLPSGEFVAAKSVPLQMDPGGPEQSVSVAIELNFVPRGEGVYWFCLSWNSDGNILTRVPLTAKYLT